MTPQQTPPDTFRLIREIAKLMALFHDPPWKELVITQNLEYKNGLNKPYSSLAPIYEHMCEIVRNVSPLTKTSDGNIESRQCRVLRELLKRKNYENLPNGEELYCKVRVIVHTLEEILSRIDFVECSKRYLEEISPKDSRRNNKKRSKKPSAHEYHGLFLFYFIVVGLIEGLRKLEREGHFRELNVDISRLADEIESALGVSIGGCGLSCDNQCRDSLRKAWRLVKKADIFASTLDRYTIYGIVGSRVESGKNLVFRNLFRPSLEYSMGGSNGQGTAGNQATNTNRANIDNTDNERDLRRRSQKIACYILSLSVLVTLYYAEYLRHKGGALNQGVLEHVRALFEIVAGVYEALWYTIGRTTSLAETRSPTHSIFDHNMAVAASTLFYKRRGSRISQEPFGCLVKVKLHSLHGWLAETRRLRDLWAASWLASYLTWRTIEPWVERHGPAVMMRPPSRLHPFYSSKLWARICGPEAPKYALEARKITKTGDNPCLLLKRMLGLYWSWPIDPVSPDEAILVLPEEECSDKNAVLEKAWDNYWGAWREVVDLVLIGKGLDGEGLGVEKKFLGLHRFLKELQQHLGSLGEKGEACVLRTTADNRAECLFKNLEPPLPIEVTVSRLADSLGEVDKRVDEHYLRKGVCEEATWCLENPGKKVGSVVKEIKYKMAYDLAFRRLYWSGFDGVSPRGGRGGGGYLELARFYHCSCEECPEPGGSFKQCTVCGRAPAVVDGDELSRILDRLNSDGGGHQNYVWEQLIALKREVGEERLCPYCYVKRLFRRVVRDYSRRLVGIDMPKGIYRLLHVKTVDVLTTRTRLGYAALMRWVQELVPLLNELQKNEEEAYRVIRGSVAPNTFLEPRDKRHIRKQTGVERDIVDLAEALVLEAAHDEAFARNLRDRLRTRLRVPVEEAGSYTGRVVGLLERVSRDGDVARYRKNISLIYMDGDSMGRLLSGELGLDPYSYVENVLHLACRWEGFRRVVAGINELAVKVYRDNVLKNIFSERVASEGTKLTTLATPSFHYTVSRSLAVQAVLDRSAIESLGGLPIYVAGDDLIAVLPPYEALRREPCRDEFTALPSSLETLETLRSTYWGTHPPTHPYVGEHVLHSKGLRRVYKATARPGVGFNSLPDVMVPVPALAAYGRSAALLTIDIKYPLWLAIDSLRSLLDLAKALKRTGGGAPSGDGKDTAVIASQSRAAALLPLSTPPVGGEGSLLLHSPRLAEVLLHAAHAGELDTSSRPRPLLTRGIFRDLLGEEERLRLIAEKSTLLAPGGEGGEALRTYYRSLLRRNEARPGGAEELLNLLKNQLPGDGDRREETLTASGGFEQIAFKNPIYAVLEPDSVKRNGLEATVQEWLDPQVLARLWSQARNGNALARRLLPLELARAAFVIQGSL